MSDIEKRTTSSPDQMSGNSDFHDRTFRIYGAIACIESQTSIEFGRRRRRSHADGSITDTRRTTFGAIPLKTSPRSEWGKWTVAIERESIVTRRLPLYVPGVESEALGDQMDVETKAWFTVSKMAGNTAVGGTIILYADLPPIVHATDPLGDWVYTAVHPDVLHGLPEQVTDQYEQPYDWIEHTAYSLGINMSQPSD